MRIKSLALIVALGGLSGVVSAQNALVASFVAAGVAVVVLLTALVRSDFSFTYVSAFTSRELPLAYKFTALWGGQEGSLLLWLLVLTGAASVALALNRRLVREVLPWTVAIVGGVALFFAFLLVFIASPFDTQVAPADGAGMNPSLQNPYMIAHPPMLYLGYVGLTIPFAFAMAALASRRVDERWIVVTRRWTLAAWTFLGFGIQDPIPTWGNMLAASQQFMFDRPWLPLVPGLPIVLCSLAFNYIGDGLRDALDPRLKL